MGIATTVSCADDLPRRPRYESLDLWRGLACLMIVLVHGALYADAYPPGERPEADGAGLLAADLVSRLAYGVHLFFVISGYCIAATADSTRRKSGASLNYFKRRFRRIFPPYWAALALSLAGVVLLAALGLPAVLTDGEGTIPPPWDLTPSQWLGNLTLTEHWRHHLFGSEENKILGPSWTLCYEEQFYVVCGLILLAAPRRFFLGAAVVTALTACLTPLAFVDAGFSIRGFFFDGRWLLFATGVLVYYHVNYATASGRRCILGFLGLCLISALALRYGLLLNGTREQKEHAFEFVVGSGFALVLIGLHRWDRALTRAPLLAPVAFCGTMCYSLYLIHWPVSKAICHTLWLNGLRGPWPTLLIAMPLAAVASILASWVFYLLVERRFLNPPYRPTDAPEGPPARPARTARPALELEAAR
jgi:peptidoglycan/LPS O-acetylase OafA/YrhL